MSQALTIKDLLNIIIKYMYNPTYVIKINIKPVYWFSFDDVFKFKFLEDLKLSHSNIKLLNISKLLYYIINDNIDLSLELYYSDIPITDVYIDNNSRNITFILSNDAEYKGKVTNLFVNEFFDDVFHYKSSTYKNWEQLFDKEWQKN
jgi:hypothetical protein